MLDARTFSSYLDPRPALAEVIRGCVEQNPGRRHLGHLTSAIEHLFMARLVQGLIRELGFPWERETGEYSDDDLRRLVAWIDREYRNPGDSRASVERAALRLMARLQRVNATEEKRDWEGLRRL